MIIVLWFLCFSFLIVYIVYVPFFQEQGIYEPEGNFPAYESGKKTAHAHDP